MLHFSPSTSSWCEEFTLSTKFSEGDTICEYDTGADDWDDECDIDNDSDGDDDDDDVVDCCVDDEEVVGEKDEEGGILVFVLTETATAAI